MNQPVRTSLTQNLLLYLHPDNIHPPPPDFGLCIRPGVEHPGPQYQGFQATWMLYYYILCSPVPNAVSLEILSKIRCITTPNGGIIIEKLQSPRVAPDAIATIRTLNLDPSEVLPVNQFASDVFGLLGVGMLNPSGDTPQVSAQTTPGPEREHEIKRLLDEIAAEGDIRKKQGILRKLILRRDGFRCPVSQITFLPLAKPFLMRSIPGVTAECAHILPVSLSKNPKTVRMIEMFTGLQLGDILKDKIMHPSNAIALQGDVHKAFDNLLWSIEAVTQENNNIQYIFRCIHPENLPPALFPCQDGDHLAFGPRGPIDTIEDIRPDPRFLNIHHAIHRLLILSGAAEAVWSGMIDDDDGGGGCPGLTVSDIPYLGHSDVTDTMFLDSLTQRLQSV